MSGYTPPLSDGSRCVDPAGTDNELSGLLGSIRKHVLETPSDVWDPDVRSAAKTVSAALASRLAQNRRR